MEVLIAVVLLCASQLSLLCLLTGPLGGGANFMVPLWLLIVLGGAATPAGREALLASLYGSTHCYYQQVVRDPLRCFACGMHDYPLPRGGRAVPLRCHMLPHCAHCSVGEVRTALLHLLARKFPLPVAHTIVAHFFT